MDALLNSKIGRELKDYVAITLGIMCYALGWAAFLLPYQISNSTETNSIVNFCSVYCFLLIPIFVYFTCKGIDNFRK